MQRATPNHTLSRYCTWAQGKLYLLTVTSLSERRNNTETATVLKLVFLKKDI
jgi:hypothetical protein